MTLFKRGPELHTFDIQGVACVTDVPPEVDLFDTETALRAESDGRMGYGLNMPATDVIDPGEYLIKARIEPYPGGGIRRSHRQSVIVRESGPGRVIDRRSFGVDPLRFRSAQEQQATLPLMGQLGFETDGSTVTGWPTPVTFVTAALQLGIRVRTLPGRGELPDEPFIAAFAAGEYPVGVGDQGYYVHDTGDDHASAKVLGGDVLTGVLTQMAGDGLEAARSGDRVPSMPLMPKNGWLGATALALDSYTSILRASVVDDGRDWGESGRYYYERHYYGAAEGAQQALYAVGRVMGVPSQRTDEVLEAARDTARSLGVPVAAA